MVATLPGWMLYVLLGVIAFGVGYEFCKFHEDPKAWLHDWFN